MESIPSSLFNQEPACKHAWGGVRVPRWWGLRPYWDWIYSLAEQRHRQKQKFSTTRNWNTQSHHVGLLGELVYALETNTSIDVRLRVSGDGGQDFDCVDVKTSVFWRDPWLKHPINAKWWPVYFALVSLDLSNQRGLLIGIVSAQRLRSAAIRDWGHGPQYSLSWRECRNYVSDITCRFCGGKKL